jgi:MFS family permease
MNRGKDVAEERLILLTYLFNTLPLGALLFLVPWVGLEKDLPVEIIILAAATEQLGYLIFGLKLSSLGDRFNKIQLLKLSSLIWLILLTLFSLIFLLTHSFVILVLILFLAGGISSLFMPVTFSLLKERSTRKEQGFVFSIDQCLFVGLGPAIAALMLLFIESNSIPLLLIAGPLVSLLLTFFLKEKEEYLNKAEPILSNLKTIFKRKSLLRDFLLVGFAWNLFAFYGWLIVPFLKTSGFSEVSLLIIFFIAGGATLISPYLLNKDLFKRLSLAFIIQAGAFILLLNRPGFHVALISLSILFLTASFIVSSLVIIRSEEATKKEQSFIAGVGGVTHRSGFVLAAPLAALIYLVSGSFALIWLIEAIALLILAFYIMKKQSLLTRVENAS